MAGIRNEEINTTHLDTINWGQASLPIGVETNEVRPWLALSLDEMRILRNLLRKPLPLAQRLDDGHITIETLDPAINVGNGLATFAQWLDAAIAWKQANPEK